mmetsp:Transcript_27679/g.65232  ORF Transcript_27679/g.65232 Transcript_27679/m.65232 type:complete len:314 (-) Transcript_27679:818-1759(-)
MHAIQVSEVPVEVRLGAADKVNQLGDDSLVCPGQTGGRFLLLAGGHELLDVGLHVALENHKRAHVASVAAVVRRREKRQQLRAVRELKAIRYTLVRADHQVDVVRLAERLCDILPEEVPGATARRSHTTRVLRVTPHHVLEQAILESAARQRNLAETVHRLQVADTDATALEQASMDHKDVILQHRAQWQGVEALLEHIVNLIAAVLPTCGSAGVVLVQHLHHEALHLGLGAALVVSAVDVHRARIEQLVTEDEHRDLNTVVAAVNEVTIEEVLVERRRHTVDLEDVQDVGQLAVRVTNHGEAAPLINVHVHH